MTVSDAIGFMIIGSLRKDVNIHEFGVLSFEKIKRTTAAEIMWIRY